MELDFFGKEFIRNHHLTVPYRPLLPDAEKSVGEPDLGGNLIIHGDNLHALKALLPVYAGKVDCIFIDPPYNTGNEGWSYNDNVSSPLLREWFNDNPINKEDLMRHDKWCCMMWPRLRLLKELLKEHGTIWITIDDGEVHRLRAMLDEIFGDHNFVATVCWQKKYATANDTVDFSDMHDFVLVYTNERPEAAKKKDRAVLRRLDRSDEQNSPYKNPDNDERGPYKLGDYTCNKSSEDRPNLYYPIIQPQTGQEIWPNKKRVWAYSQDRHLRNIADKRVWWGLDGENLVPSYKRFLSEVDGSVSSTWWPHEVVGHTDEAKKTLQEIFADYDEIFATPKPVRLLERILELAIGDLDEALILDSFAGSATTAHAILNRGDNNHRFILVESESYADTLTAERVRRVILGYPFTGNQRETLFEKSLTWTDFKKGDALRKQAEEIKEAAKDSFDKVKIEVKKGTLQVIGERTVAQTAPGLGGSFTYCTLGDPVDQDEILKRQQLPDRRALADWLLYTAFGTAKLDDSALTALGDLTEHYVGRTHNTHVWLLYQPDRAYLLGPSAALTLDLAKQIYATNRLSKHLVFSPSKYVSQKMLKRETKNGVDHAPLPFSLFQLERE